MARTTPFLRYLRIERFGRFHDKTVGPFDRSEEHTSELQSPS